MGFLKTTKRRRSAFFILIFIFISPTIFFSDERFFPETAFVLSATLTEAVAATAVGLGRCCSRAALVGDAAATLRVLVGFRDSQTLPTSFLKSSLPVARHDPWRWRRSLPKRRWGAGTAQLVVDDCWLATFSFIKLAAEGAAAALFCSVISGFDGDVFEVSCWRCSLQEPSR